MPRSRRADLPDATHHVVNRGVDRQRIFVDDLDRVHFLDLIAEANVRYSISIVSYCLMDNHYHLMVHCPDARLSAAMQFIGGRYADHINARHNRTGHLFGSRFHSSHLDSEAYALATLRYTERNSLDIPGVRSPVEYRWSSMRAHLGLRRAPHWLDTAKVGRWFPSLDAFQTFVSRPWAQDEPAELDVRQARSVAAMFVATQVESSISPIHLDRAVLLVVSQQLGTTNRRRLLDELDLTTPASISRATRRANRRIGDEPSILAAIAATKAWLFDVSAHHGHRAA